MTKQIIELDSSEFKPSKDLMLVRPEKVVSEKISAGGIIMPTAKNSIMDERPTSGIVVAIGESIEVAKEGDFVIWPAQDGIDLEFNDGDFLLLREKSIIGFKK